MAKDYTIIDRPWWLSHAVETSRGVIVARADARSTTLRKPTQDDLDGEIAFSESDYSDKCHGEFLPLMIDLTDQDIADMSLTPGLLVWPDVIDGERPNTNLTTKPISQESAQHTIDLLINERASSGDCDE